MCDCLKETDKEFNSNSSKRFLWKTCKYRIKTSEINTTFAFRSPGRKHISSPNNSQVGSLQGAGAGSPGLSAELVSEAA